MMNLADMLTYADIGQLTAMAGRYQCDCKRNSKHDLIQSLLILLGSRDFMESHIRSCKPEELRFLNTLLLMNAATLALRICWQQPNRLPSTVLTVKTADTVK